jgi:hypothetical protein
MFSETTGARLMVGALEASTATSVALERRPVTYPIRAEIAGSYMHAFYTRELYREVSSYFLRFNPT